MPGRILLADSSRTVVAALRREAAPLGLDVDAADPAEAEAHVDPEGHALAIVRGSPEGRALIAALRAADPLLPLLVLYHDDEEAQAAGSVAEADGALAGPLTPAAIRGALRLALALRDARARVGEAEARAARLPRQGHDLDFLRRLILVEVRRSRRYRFPVSLVLLALDRWPDAGAGLTRRERFAVLADVLAVLTRSVRDIDVVVPFPDDRFLVLVPHTGRAGALPAAARMCARIREHPGLVRVTASAGVASHEGDGTVAFGGLVKRAAEALSRARAEGGDRALAAEAPRRRDRIVMG
jgi:diguanylate cyclase (GGDEF)-like protein